MVELLQIVDLFDTLVLLREGHVVYNGPRADVLPYLAQFGIHCPEAQDVADFLVAFLNDPDGTLVKQRKQKVNDDEPRPEQHVALMSDDSKKEDSNGLKPTVVLKPANGKRSILSTSAMVDAWHASTYHTANLQLLKQREAERSAVNGTSAPVSASAVEDSLAKPVVDLLDSSQMNPYARAQYGQPFPHTMWQHLQLNVRRQTMFMQRNTTFWIPRLVQSVILGLILGSLFYNLPPSDFQNRIGLVVYSLIMQCFSNWSEIPIAVEAKAVLLKQMSAGFYPSFSYILAVITVHMPLAITESTIFSM